MARPREFDEEVVLEGAVRLFWRYGYGSTSIRELVDTTGVTGASLYNAFGDKRALFRKAFDRYVEDSIAQRMRSCEQLAPREAIAAFLSDIVKRSVDDGECKGCMLVNVALEMAPQDPGLRTIVARVLVRIERFFLRCVKAGQADGTITRSLPAKDLARHCLGVVMGIRVLARVRPERALLAGIVAPVLALLDSTQAVKG